MKERKLKKLADTTTGKSAAQILFGDLQVLTKRPDDMSFEDYKKLRMIQQITLRKMYAGLKR